MDDILLGIDVGTYSTKGVLVDSSGAVLRSATTQNTVDIPQAGWAEQHPDDVWWAGLCTVANQLLDGFDRSRIAGIGVSAIGPCMVPLDASGAPLRAGILYGVDTRASKQITAMEDRIGPSEIINWSAMELSSQAVGPKIAWFRETEPELWDHTASIATASSYLVFRLTGELVIDHHQAAHFIPLYNPKAQTWSERYADGICDPSMLPELKWSDDLAGAVTPAASRATGIPEGTPVVVGGVDALSEAVSVGVVSPGDLMIMYGSTAFLILATPERVIQPPLWSLPGAFEGSHVVAAGMATSGSLTRWLADLTGDPEDVNATYGHLFAEAERVPIGSNGLVMLPYFSGERTPINDPKARGVIAGLSLAHHRGHLFRAALEAIANGIRHNLEAMDPDRAVIRRCVAVGGGTQGSLWLQIVSDVTGQTQHVPKQTIGASYGDAYLAGRGTGLIDWDKLSEWVEYQRIVTPDTAAAPAYDARYRAFLELYDVTAPLVHRLSTD